MNVRIKKITKFIILNIIAIIGVLLLAYYKFEIDCVREQSELFVIMSIILSIVAIFISICIYLNKKINQEKIFLMIVPILCLLFMIFMPIYRAHDEEAHWYRAYEISEGKLLSEVKDNKVVSNLPKSVIIINGLGKKWEEIRYTDLIENVDKHIDNEDRDYVDTSLVAVYSPIQYIPQSIGIGIARIFSENILTIAYTGRMFNMIVSLVLVYLSIKIAPFGKNIILLISMLPLSIQAFASLSPDAMTISVSLLLVSYILRIIYTENYKISKKDKIILLILGFFMAMCKIVYVPLIGLTLLIPSEKYKSKKEKVIYTFFIILITCIFSVGWLTIANSYLEVSSNGESTQKIMTIFSSPIDYFKELIYTINYSGNRYFMTLFGSVLGSCEVIQLYSIVPFIFSTLFFVEALTNNELKKKFSLYQTMILILVALAVIALIFTSLYVQWTKIYARTIQGVQGRYFIPILFVIALILSKIKIRREYSENLYAKLIGIIGIIMYIYIILSIIIVHL